MADTITIRTATERDVVKIVERGPQGPAGGGGGGSGTVTSVALASSDLTITGSPITSSGTITANLANSGATAGTYTKVTVDAKGRVTSGATATASDVGAAAAVNPSVIGTLEVVDGVISCSQYGMTINAEENVITFSSVPALNGATILREGDLGNQLVLNANGSNSGAFTGGTGGSVDVRGGNAISPGGNGGNGGSINLRGGDAANNQGGSGEPGGSIDLSGSSAGAGGSINLSSGGNGNGGSINTSAGGGSINTSAGGGSIDTRGTGSIEFGVSGTRTTLTGAATADRAISLPNASGTIALTSDFASPPAIGSTTRNTGAFTTLNATNGTITASAPVLDLSQTWNNASVTFTGLRFNATDTASATASNLAEFQLSGTALAAIRKDGSFRVLGTGDRTVLAHPNFALSAVAGGAWLGVNTTISLSSAGNFVTAGVLIRLNDVTSANPVELNRDAADTLAQRRTTNPQAFRLYNTTDAGLTNFERGFMRWSSNVLQIGTEKLGTGSARALELQTDGTSRLTINTAGIFQFGGTTSSFPALKRSSTALQVRLADDSAYSVLDAQLRAQGTAPATSGATGTAGDIRYDADYIYVCTATNTWKRAAIATW